MLIPLSRRCIARLSLFGLFLAGFLPNTAFATTPFSVVIGEINWAGSSRSAADEWIELWNRNATPITLDGWRLTGAGGTAGIPFTSQDAIPAHGVFLLANYDSSDTKSVLDVIPDVVTTTLSLPNDRCDIRLLMPDGAVVDQACNGSAPFAGSAGSQKMSMLRNHTNLSGTQTDAWVSATDQRGIDSGVDDRGTPGWFDRDPVYVTSTADAFALLVSSTTTLILDDTTTTIMLETTSTPLLTTSTRMETTTTFDGTVNELLLRVSSTSITSLFSELSSSTVSSTVSMNAPSSSTSISLFSPRLNEIMASPTDGHEWIELMGVGHDDLPELDGWTIEDARGIIMRLTSSTMRDLTFAPPFLQIVLPGHHLNNAGDLVILRRPDHAVSDTTTYPKLTSTQSWMRLDDPSETWRVTQRITPAARNVWFAPRTGSFDGVLNDATASVAVSSNASSPLTEAFSETSSTVPSSTTRVIVIRERILTPVSPPYDIASPSSSTILIQQTTISPMSSTIASQRLSNTVKATTINGQKKNVDSSAPRLHLSGVVASVVGLLAKQTFIIHTSDGRGLLVRGNNQQPSPPFGKRVHLTGTLTMNDSGASFILGKHDRWQLDTSSSSDVIAPRFVELLAPSIEDAWSLVEVTGTVREIHPALITLDTDETTVSARIRPVMRYRTQRLHVGDQLRIRGLLEPSLDDPHLLPRTPDDILLLASAPRPPMPSDQRSSLPPWTPFGAAGMTVAVVQGWKRVKKIYDHRRLQHLLHQAEDHLSSAI